LQVFCFCDLSYPIQKNFSDAKLKGAFSRPDVFSFVPAREEQNHARTAPHDHHGI
jgi:hypothetical protein